MHRNKSTLQACIEDRSDLRKVNASMLVVIADTDEGERSAVLTRPPSAPKQMHAY